MTMRMLSVPLLLCAVMVLTTAAPTAGEHAVVKRYIKCPNEWYNWNEHCYKFEDSQVAWAYAEKTCLSQGANLASIHSKTEHTFIQDMIRFKTGAMPKTWIGGYDVTGTNGAWMWSDGSPMTFTAWGKGEPNNHKGKQQNCMAMNWSDQKLWDDSAWDNKFPYVCKKQTDENTA